MAGELVPTPLTRSLAVGGRALWDLPAGLRLPPGFALQSAGSHAGSSPDGPPDPVLVGELLTRALAGQTVRVPADPARRELSFAEVIALLRGAAVADSGGGGVGSSGGGGVGSGGGGVGSGGGGGVGSGGGGAGFGRGGRLDYALDIGAHLRLVVLDLVRRDGGSGGLVVDGQPEWLARQIAAAALAG